VTVALTPQSRHPTYESSHARRRQARKFVACVGLPASAQPTDYAHLFSGHIESVEESAAPATAREGSLAARVERLEAIVEELRAEVARLGGTA
jgi:uncharacterized protein YceH (UPF0502 family)